MRGIIESTSREGGPRLAIRLGGTGARPSGQAMARLLRSSGILIARGKVEEWRLEGTEDEGGELLFYGPAFQGKSLDALCSGCGPGREPNTDEALAALNSLAESLALAAEGGALPEAFLSSGILVGEGGVLVLPYELARRAFRALGLEAREGAAAFLRSPRAEGAAAEAAFLVAQAAYRAVAGASAYPVGGGEEELAAGGFIPLAELCPRLEPRLAAAVDAALASPEAASLGRLREALAEASASGWRRELTEEEGRASERRLAAAAAKLEAKRKRDAFLRKRRNLLIGAGAGLALILVVALSVADARRGRPHFESLGPLELAQAYYRAVDAMDLASIDACAERSASKADEDYVSTMTVVSKMRQAYEGKNPTVSATEWLAKGRPEIAADGNLYGITGLKLSLVSSGEREAVVEAEYSSWALDKGDKAEAEIRGEAGAAKAVVIERRLRDELRLEKRGAKGWRIAKLDRSER